MEWWSESWWNTTETPLEVTMCSYQWCTNRTTHEVVLMNTLMSRDKLLARGYCCGLGCRNCPYDPPHQEGNTVSWDCEPEGDCWCKEMPNVLPISGSECLSPTELKKIINDKDNIR